MKILFVIMFFALIGCENNQEVLPEVAILPQHVTYTGLDMNGDQRVCEEALPDLICTSVFGPEDQFAEDCKAGGSRPITCGCHDYICLEGSESGMDINGSQRSCTPMSPDTICTMEFTDEDQYGSDCSASGYEAVQCGCHDWICKK